MYDCFVSKYHGNDTHPTRDIPSCCSLKTNSFTDSTWWVPHDHKLGGCSKETAHHKFQWPTTLLQFSGLPWLLLRYRSQIQLVLGLLKWLRSQTRKTFPSYLILQLLLVLSHRTFLDYVALLIQSRQYIYTLIFDLYFCYATLVVASEEVTTEYILIDVITARFKGRAKSCPCLCPLYASLNCLRQVSVSRGNAWAKIHFSMTFL